MKPAPFKYLAPTSTAEALGFIAENGDDAKVLAGGQSLIPTMNFRLAQPAVLIDLNPVSELAYIREGKRGSLRIGAMTRHADIEHSPLVAKHSPLLFETMPFIAHPQIRNRGTIGGSIVHADPAAELPAIMAALNAKFKLQNQQGERWVTATDFFTGMFATAMEAGELLTEIEIPAMPDRCGWAFTEVARRHGDYALVGVGTIIQFDRKQRCKEARIALLSVGEGPVLAHQAAQQLQGESFSESRIQSVAETCANDDIDPGGDIHASADYRRHLAKVLTRKVLSRAFQRVRD